MNSLTANSVIAELESTEGYEQEVMIGLKVKSAIRKDANSPYLAMDVFEGVKDRLKARSFMEGVICS